MGRPDKELDPAIPAHRVSAAIKALRKDLALTQSELAEEIRFSVSAVKRAETGYLPSERLIAAIEQLGSADHSKAQQVLRQEYDAARNRQDIARSNEAVLAWADRRSDNSRSGIRLVTQAEFYSILAADILTAERQIDLTHHEALPPTYTGIASKRAYFESLRARIIESEIRVRRITTIPTLEKLTWVRAYLQEFEECSNFHLRLSSFSIMARNTPPAMSLQIIDRRSCFLINLKLGSHTETLDDQDCHIDHPALARYMSNYYDAYWDRSRPLKEGTRIYVDELDALEEQLSAQEKYRQQPD